MDDIRDEKSSLQKILLEIRNLKEASEKLRRQKENLVAENLVAEHKFKESDQERYLMVAGMEAERSRLQALRDERMKVVDQKEKLVGCIDDVRLVKKLFLQTVWGGTTVLRKVYRVSLEIRKNFLSFRTTKVSPLAAAKAASPYTIFPVTSGSGKHSTEVVQ